MTENKQNKQKEIIEEVIKAYNLVNDGWTIITECLTNDNANVLYNLMNKKGIK